MGRLVHFVRQRGNQLPNRLIVEVDRVMCDRFMARRVFNQRPE